MKKIPYIPQKFDYDCGAASATMVAKGLGVNTNLQEMTKLCNTTKEYGTSPTLLVEGLQKVGLTATIHDKLRKEDLVSLLSKDCLVILDYWDYEEGHYVVLSDIVDYGDGTSQIVVVDPAYDLDENDPDPSVAIDWDYFYTNWLDYEVKGNNRIFSDRLAIVVEKPTSKSSKK